MRMVLSDEEPIVVTSRRCYEKRREPGFKFKRSNVQMLFNQGNVMQFKLIPQSFLVLIALAAPSISTISSRTTTIHLVCDLSVHETMGMLPSEMYRNFIYCTPAAH